MLVKPWTCWMGWTWRANALKYAWPNLRTKNSKKRNSSAKCRSKWPWGESGFSDLESLFFCSGGFGFSMRPGFPGAPRFPGPWHMHSGYNYGGQHNNGYHHNHNGFGNDQWSDYTFGYPMNVRVLVKSHCAMFRNRSTVEKWVLEWTAVGAVVVAAVTVTRTAVQMATQMAVTAHRNGQTDKSIETIKKRRTEQNHSIVLFTPERPSLYNHTFILALIFWFSPSPTFLPVSPAWYMYISSSLYC